MPGNKTFSTVTEVECRTVIKTFRTAAAGGKSHETKYYELEAIIVVGYESNS